MVLHQMLVKVLDGEALVALAVEPLDLRGPVSWDPFARGLAEPAVQEPGLAVVFVATRPAPERPLSHPEQLGRLRLIELRRFPAVEKIQKHRHAHSLTGLGPAHPTPPKKGQIYRTDRALPKPDISSATDTILAAQFQNRDNRRIVIVGGRGRMGIKHLRHRSLLRGICDTTRDTRSAAAHPHSIFIRPCEPALVAYPPAGPGWLHEIKHDGFRILAWKRSERLKAWSRGGTRQLSSIR